MGGLVGGFTIEELEFTGTPLFEKDEIVSHLCHGVMSDQKWGSVTLQTKCLTGPNEGKECELVVQHNDSIKFVQQIERQFAKAFFTQEELVGKAAPLQKLVGLRFECRALEARQAQNGKTYQSFTDFKNMGKAEDSGIPF